MNQHKTGMPVLARFPDLDDGTHDTGPNKPSHFGLLASSGRLISQTLSIKLLAGIALFLLVGAVLPFCIGKSPQPAPSSPAGDSVVSKQPKSPKSTPKTTAGDAGALTANRPAVRVPATKEPSAAPAMLPASFEAASKPQAEAPLASNWTPAPPQLQPNRVPGELPQPGLNQPSANRPTEYEANRAGSTPLNERETRR